MVDLVSVCAVKKKRKGKRWRERKKKEKNRLQLQSGPFWGLIFPITVTGVLPPENQLTITVTVGALPGIRNVIIIARMVSEKIY